MIWVVIFGAIVLEDGLARTCLEICVHQPFVVYLLLAVIIGVAVSRCKRQFFLVMMRSYASVIVVSLEHTHECCICVI